jgi:molybdopterin-containing oxidoreductase family molybdopterin binding subunit
MAKTKQDEWIPTTCNMCFNGCGILVHVVDGVVVKIKGDKRNPTAEGHPCGKGQAGIMQLYDPSRRTKPLKRTNPKKGLDQDPGWVEVTWDEAYDVVATQMQEALSHEGGGQNVIGYSIVSNLPGSGYRGLFFATFGGVGLWPDICGAAVHTIYNLFTGTGNAFPDYGYCKYLIQFGTQAGTATRHGFNISVGRFAKAHVDKGMKLVVADPHMGASAEKADIWLPVRPGTDMALALGIAHVLVHEAEIYDRDFLRFRTNSASLVDVETSRIYRDQETNKPFVLDLADNSIKIFDDPDIKDLALEASVTINGKQYKTGFTLYKEHIKQYDPKSIEEITTIPAERIRQVAREFGEAACIGSTITIDGVELPYRPACADSFSGVSRHKHAFHAHWAIQSLNLLVGSACNPGGLIGFGPACNGFTEEYGVPKWRPSIWEEEGLQEQCRMGLMCAPFSFYKQVREDIKTPARRNLLDIMPVNEFDPHFIYVNQLHPEDYGVKPAEFLWIHGGNPLKNWGNQDEMAEFLKSFKFVVSIDLYLNDSTYFADYFMPEAAYLERYDIPPNVSFNHHTPGGMDMPWTLSIRQPVVPAKDNCPSSIIIVNNIAERMGLTGKFNGMLNHLWTFGGKGAVGDAANLPMDRMATEEEVLDLWYKSILGPDRGVEWFKKNGAYTFPRKVDEVYILKGTKARLPFYFDFMSEAKEKIDAVTAENNIPWDTSDYLPLPTWKPCHDFHVHNEGYDLFPIYSTSAVNVDTWQLQNPWLNEINEGESYGYNIEINSETAKKKNLKSGDQVVLRAANGYETTGRLIVVEGVHPEAISVGGGCWGSRSDYMPISKGKGTPVNNLLTATTPERLDHISAAYDQCVRVKIIKTQEG